MPNWPTPTWWRTQTSRSTVLMIAASAASLLPLMWLMGPHLRAERPPGIGPLWVVFGFMAQALFAGRLIVQWMATEKHRRSVVPTSFWWLSLIGGGMLLVYFWRRGDPVGTAGQLFGNVVYIRNLHFVYRERRRAALGLPAQSGRAEAVRADLGTPSRRGAAVPLRLLPPVGPAPSAQGRPRPSRPAPASQSRQRQ